MKGDFSRQTFARKNHYSSVRMQQGRVQLDADWNEQSDIVGHRAQTTTRDLIGACGGPLGGAAFEVILLPRVVSEPPVIPPSGVALAELARGVIDPSGVAPIARFTRKRNIGDDFLLGKGRYYADGILCENEQAVPYSNQPDFPEATTFGNFPFNDEAALYLLYLDVWQRHLTALDDPHIRETALGGPDTATRTKTIWQAKLWKVSGAGGVSCPDIFRAFMTAEGDRNKGLLNASSVPEDAGSNPCIVPPSAGFRGLENLLYRVEVHAGGKAADVSTNAGSLIVASFDNTARNQLTLKAGPAPSVGTAVELYPAKAGSDAMAGRLYFVTNVSDLTLTLSRDIQGLEISQQPRLRVATSTFKWSRQNGSVVTKVECISTQDKKQITVQSLGPDDDLGFSDGDWVELTDDLTELRGEPGQLTQIVTADNASRIVMLKDAPNVLTSRNAKMRRWDGIANIRMNSADADHNWVALENGLRIQFPTRGIDGSTLGVYATGDYWLIPTRTATADRESGQIEWPQDKTSGKPVPQPPEGIEHHYCPLALLNWSIKDGVRRASDCRRFFPPVTELTTLHYVSGTGQKFMPVLVPPEQKLVELVHPLVVGVSNGSTPVKGAHVVFEIMEGDDEKAVPKLAEPHATAPAPNGRLSAVPNDPAIGGPDTRVEVVTDENGRARCKWEVSTTAWNQQVRATLLGQDGQTVIHLPVYFGAHRSSAEEVAYKPEKCDKLKGIQTVQAALDTLCNLIGLADEPGIHVTDISFGAFALRKKLLPTKQSTNIPNDFDLACDALAEGLTITCDREVFRNSVRGKPTCFITLELPYPSGRSEKEAWLMKVGDGGFFGYQPIVLDGDPDAEGNSISWNPSEFAGEWLRESLPTLLGMFKSSNTGLRRSGRVLARLTLKGNYIWSSTDANLYLDGELFGVAESDSNVTSARGPSGDGKRGGDLELWFWLVQFELVLDKQELNVGETTKGRVILSGPAPPQGTTVELSNSNKAAAKLSRTTVTFKEGETEGAFEVTALKQGPAVISASYAGGERQVSVNVSVAPLPRVEAVRVYRWQLTPGNEMLKEMNPSTGFPDGRVMIVQQTKTPNAIEVKFTADAPINMSTVTTKTFIVEAMSTQKTVPGSITSATSTPNAVLWKADQMLPADDYRVRLIGADIISTKGRRLDGDPKQLPSGDEQEGGTFEFTVRVEKPPAPQVTLLKVTRVSLLNNITFANPEAIIFQRVQGQPMTTDIDLGKDQRLNVVEVEFTGSRVNKTSVILNTAQKEGNFCVWNVTLNSIGDQQAGVLEWKSESVVRWTAPKELAKGGYIFALLAGSTPAGNFTQPLKPITDTDGHQLDGEPTQLPSGDNKEGGTFFLKFKVS